MEENNQTLFGHSNEPFLDTNSVSLMLQMVKGYPDKSVDCIEHFIQR